MLYQTQHSTTTDKVTLESGIDLIFPTHIHNSFEIIIATQGEIEITVSNKIDDDEIRENLVNLIMENANSGGFTIRTSAKDAKKDDILAEMRCLENLFDEIVKKAKSSDAPCLLYLKDNIIEDILARETTCLDKVVVDNHLCFFFGFAFCRNIFI